MVTSKLFTCWELKLEVQGDNFHVAGRYKQGKGGKAGKIGVLFCAGLTFGLCAIGQKCTTMEEW